MAKPHCHLLIYINHALVPNFNSANVPFNAIRENELSEKKIKFTVHWDNAM